MVKKFLRFIRFFSPHLQLFPYLFLGSFIMGWWVLAFHPTSSPPPFSIETTQTLALKTSSLLEELSPLQRETLQNALAGDFPTLLHLIDQWDQDALLLTNKGIPGIQRLSSESYLQAHVLSHLLQNSSSTALHALNCKMNLEWMCDDDGHSMRIEDHFQHFLPQTHISADFLLAIAPPHEIIALPKGLRHLHRHYSSDAHKKVPADIGQMHSERLYLKKPDLAFVAPYSHPPSLEALRNQHIALYSIRHVNTIHEIQEALLKVGHASNHILEAQLLAIFIDACLISIDNRFKALNEKCPDMQMSRKLLYLSHRQHYALPTMKCLSGQLMARALSHCPHLCNTIPDSPTEWRILFSQEQILQSDPSVLVISTYAPPQSILDPAFYETEAFKSKQIFYINEVLQESPTQYIALAYFDIFQALAATYHL